MLLVVTIMFLGYKTGSNKSLVNYKKKTVLITGSTRGIGLYIVNYLKPDKYQIVINSRSQKDINTVVDKLKSKGYDVIGVKADVGVKKDINYLFDTTINTFNKVDILILNSYTVNEMHGKDDIHKRILDFEKSMYANIYSVIGLSLLTINWMINNGGMGKIILIGAGCSNDKVGSTCPIDYVFYKNSAKKFISLLSAEVSNYNIGICELEVDKSYNTRLNNYNSGLDSPKELMKIIDYIINQKNKDINGKTIVSSRFLTDPELSMTVDTSVHLYNHSKYISDLSDKITYHNKSDYVPYNNNYKLSDNVSNFIDNYNHKKDLMKYPTEYDQTLRALSRKFKLNRPDYITFYNSSSEALNVIMKVFGESGRKVLRFNPEWATIDTIINNYTMIPEYLDYNNYQIDFKSLEDYVNNNVKIIYLSYPNYPSGKCFSKEDFDRLIEIVPKNIIIIVDQCYIEYSDCEEILPVNYYIKNHYNIIFTRTFSKFYGVPGIFGYTLSNFKLAAQLKAHNNFHLLSNFHDSLISLILSDDDFNRSKKQWNKGEIRKMEEFLNKKNIKFIRSQTNFMLIQLDFSKLGKLVEQTDRNSYPDGYYLYIIGSEETNEKTRGAICHYLDK